MCDPYSIASLALIAAGTAAQQYGEYKSDKKQSQTLDEESQRQNDLQAKSRALFDQSLNFNQDAAFKDRENEASKGLSDAFNQTTNAAFDNLDPYTVGQAEAPKTISDTFKSAIQSSKDALGKQLGAKAKLAGIDSALAQASIQNQQIAGQQSAIGNFMRGSSNVLPLELADAKHAGDSWNAYGGLASAIGGGVGKAGLSNQAKPAPKVGIAAAAKS